MNYVEWPSSMYLLVRKRLRIVIWAVSKIQLNYFPSPLLAGECQCDGILK